MASYIDESKKKDLIDKNEINLEEIKDNPAEEKKTIYNENIINSLNNLIKELEGIREKIRGKKLDEMSEEEFNSLDKKFGNLIKEYDKLKSEEDLTSDEFKELYKDASNILYLNKCLSVQTLISRIAHKVNKHKNDILIKKYEKKLQLNENAVEAYSEGLREFIEFKDSFDILKNELSEFKDNFSTFKNEFDEIKNEFDIVRKEIEKNKESTLTISSLVFTAFTLIQLNFTAFQNSNTYSVLDRIILFSGINIFTILGIYTIFSLIKSFIQNEKINLSSKSFFKPEIITVFIFLVILVGTFSYTLHLKSSKESKVIKEIVNLKEKTESITNLEKNINLLNTDVSNLKTQLNENNEENQSKINSLKLELETKILDVEKENFILEKNQKAKEK